MKNNFVFEIDNDLEKKFEKSKIIKVEELSLNFKIIKEDDKKNFKRISTLIEDHWSVKNVSKKKGMISLDLVKRKKTKLAFPKGDNHFDRNKDRYQFHTLLAALIYVKHKRLAIDIGGHVGLYSSALTDTFDKVVAFEPSPDNAKCFRQNASRAFLHEMALGEKKDEVYLNIATDNTGNNSIVESFGDKKVKIPVNTLDSFGFSDVDLIKIDVQGYEEQVLKGAKKTLENNWPIIIVELITHKNDPPNKKALDLLTSYGYKTLTTIGKDYIMGPK